MRRRISRYYKTIYNIAKCHLFSWDNFLRFLGMTTQRKSFIGPLKIAMDITNDCDMGCAMCLYHSPYAEREHSSIQQISVNKFSMLAKEWSRLGVKTVLLTGEGEPLMHPEIHKIIEIAKSNALEVELITNAYYLDRRLAQFLMDNKVAKVIVSLHCADSQTFQKIRPSKKEDDFKRIIDNLCFLGSFRRSGRPLIFVINVLSGLNYDNLFQMTELAKTIRADKILFKPLILGGHYNNSLLIADEKQAELISNLKLIAPTIDIPNNISDYIKTIEVHWKVGGQFFAGLPGSKYSLKLQTCYIPWVQSVIGVDGEVYGCVYCTASSLGNIFESSFRDIWYGPKYNNFRRGVFCGQRCFGRAVYPLLV